ncbi:MAG TPA: hypothetical protein VF762_08465 [Blastocatellia bacterium]|jgi:hypothetical protein
MRHRDIDKKYKNKDKRWRRLRGRRDDPDTTKQYTPQDVQAIVARAGNGAGIIRPETGDLHLPADIEAIGEGEQTNSPPRILFLIITLAFIFIAVVAYFISKMPVKN